MERWLMARAGFGSPSSLAALTGQTGCNRFTTSVFGTAFPMNFGEEKHGNTTK
jgi:hypothetical protein